MTNLSQGFLFDFAVPKNVRITLQDEDEGHEEVVEGEYVDEELAISVALLPVEVNVVL